VKLAAERIARTVLSMIGFSMSVGGRADVLEIGFRDGRFVCGQSASADAGSFATAEEKDCDKSRENGQGEAA